MSDNNTQINVTAIRHQTKQRWLAERKKRVSFLDRVEQSVSWWLVIIAGTLFALSAPHTAHTFNQLTPGAGLLAPLAVEFGLLYSAFRRKSSDKMPHLTWVMEIFLGITAVIVNGAGSFAAVINTSNLSGMSFGDMMEQFGKLAATSQVALVLVPISAFIIPIGTIVAGEGLATLVIERKHVKDDVDEQWELAAPTLLFQAYLDQLVSSGVTAGKARKMAAAYVGNGGMPESAGMPENGGITPEKTPLAKGEARRLLDALYADDPASVRLPVEHLMELTGAGKSAVYDWRASKVRSNGHVTEVQHDQ